MGCRSTPDAPEWRSRSKNTEEEEEEAACRSTRMGRHVKWQSRSRDRVVKAVRSEIWVGLRILRHRVDILEDLVFDLAGDGWRARRTALQEAKNMAGLLTFKTFGHQCAIAGVGTDHDVHCVVTLVLWSPTAIFLRRTVNPFGELLGDARSFAEGDVGGVPGAGDNAAEAAAGGVVALTSGVAGGSGCSVAGMAAVVGAGLCVRGRMWCTCAPDISGVMTR